MWSVQIGGRASRTATHSRWLIHNLKRALHPKPKCEIHMCEYSMHFMTLDVAIVKLQTHSTPDTGFATFTCYTTNQSRSLPLDWQPSRPRECWGLAESSISSTSSESESEILQSCRLLNYSSGTTTDWSRSSLHRFSLILYHLSLEDLPLRAFLGLRPNGLRPNGLRPNGVFDGEDIIQRFYGHYPTVKID